MTFVIADLLCKEKLWPVVIPQGWLTDNGKKCWWPEKNCEKLASRSVIPSGPGWIHYDCIVRKTYETYAAARSKLQIASVQSDIPDTDDENRGRGCRQKKQNPRYLPYSPPDDYNSGHGDYFVQQPNMRDDYAQPSNMIEGDSDAQSNNMIGCEDDRAQQHTMNPSGSLDNDGDSSPGYYGPTQLVPLLRHRTFQKHSSLKKHVTPAPPVIPDGLVGQAFFNGNYDQLEEGRHSIQSSSQQQFGGQPMSSVLTELQTPNRTAVESTSVGEPSLNVTAKVCIEKLIAEVIGTKQLCLDLIRMVDAVEKKLDCIPINPAPVANLPNSVTSRSTMLGKPLQEMKDVIEFEESLKDLNKFYELVRMIRSVGGNSNADCVYRALERIFSLKVLASINWGGKVVSGQPKKHGLANTKVAEAILAAIGKTSYTMTMMGVDAAKILKNMPEKYRQSMKKKCCSKGKENAGEDQFPAGQSSSPGPSGAGQSNDCQSGSSGPSSAGQINDGESDGPCSPMAGPSGQFGNTGPCGVDGPPRI